MSWLNEQIKQRKEQDDQVINESFLQMASSITSHKKISNHFDLSQDVIDDILNYFNIKAEIEIPSTINEFSDKLEFVCHRCGLVYREVKLTPKWYKNSLGIILTTFKDGTPVTLVPTFFGYKFLLNGKTCHVNKKNESMFSEYGYYFYKQLPNRKINVGDLLKYSLKSVPLQNFIVMILLLLVSTLISLLLPKISYFLYGEVVDNGKISLLISTIIFFICITISNLLLTSYKTLYMKIIDTEVELSISAAAMMRILSLPPSFFRHYSSGELSTKASYFNSLCKSIINLIFNTGFTSLFSLVYITQIFKYTPGLVVPSICVIVATIAFSLITTLSQVKVSKKQMELSAKENGDTFALINGIEKIRLSGSEKRAFARWASEYSDIARLNYNPSILLKYNTVFSTIISYAGTIVMYFFAMKTNVSVAEYYAFMTAYGMVFAAFSGIASIVLSMSQIKPIIEIIKPIMEEEPEPYENKEIVNHLNGSIEFSNVTFHYEENMPAVVNNLTLKINKGEYIAIVGKTGCGKSTLVRLLLGFEKPQKGTIYFDRKDIKSLDLKSLRRKIGVVLQDGKLFAGDIFSNIAICAPDLIQDEAFKVADIAGIGDDIRKMPMGMNTYLTDGGGGISGGQRQRLLIARALASKPQILVLDEATSALDNVTQKKVSEALDQINCTRIVIAHRLSTIKHCDRIIYLEDGKILEDGNYDELISKNDKFAELVKRQMLDKE